MKYQLWHSESESGYTMAPAGDPHRLNPSDARVVFTCEAESFNEALQKRNDFLGWGEHKPFELPYHEPSRVSFDREVAEYRKELERVRVGLLADLETAEIRGDGRSMFVFAQNSDRGVEVYGDNDVVVVELWDMDDESKPEKEVTCASYDDALDVARSWLGG